MPTSQDRSFSGNFIWDFYWGIELHPTIFGINLKQLINCRFSMMGWSVIVCSFAAKQAELDGRLNNAMFVSAALMVIYLFKFFCWESGYFTSLDIMHDRFGYYICWGVMAWVVGVLVYHLTNPVTLGAFLPDWPKLIPGVLTAYGGSLPSFIAAFVLYAVFGSLALRSQITRESNA